MSLINNNIFQEVGGDYGIQRFVGNFGAIVFAPLGGFVIDSTSNSGSSSSPGDFAAAVYIYLALKLAAAAMILCVKVSGDGRFILSCTVSVGVLMS